MAYGRKDYFWGVAPEKSVFGELQTPFNEPGKRTLTTTQRLSLVSIGVPATYILQITGVYLSIDLPGIHVLELIVDTTTKLTAYPDSEFSINFSEGGTLVVNPGETLNIYCTNNDTIDVTFSCLIYGFLQQTIV